MKNDPNIKIPFSELKRMILEQENAKESSRRGFSLFYDVIERLEGYLDDIGLTLDILENTKSCKAQEDRLKAYNALNSLYEYIEELKDSHPDR